VAVFGHFVEERGGLATVEVKDGEGIDTFAKKFKNRGNFFDF